MACKCMYKWVDGSDELDGGKKAHYSSDAELSCMVVNGLKMCACVYGFWWTCMGGFSMDFIRMHVWSACVELYT
jgi:hypothetical protein